MQGCIGPFGHGAVYLLVFLVCCSDLRAQAADSKKGGIAAPGESSISLPAPPSAGRLASSQSTQPDSAPATQPEPKTIHEMLEAAVKANNESRFAQAERLVRSVLQQDPAHPDATLLLSMVLAGQDQKLAAVQTLEDFLKTPRGRTSWEAHMLAGQHYLDSGYGRLAKARFTDAANLNPNHAGIQALLARAYKVLEDRDKALDHAQRAVSLDPNNVEALNMVSVALLDNLRFDEADRNARKAQAIAEADYRREPANLAKLEALNSQYGFLKQTLFRHIQADPGNAPLYLELARVSRLQSTVEQGLLFHRCLQYVVKADGLKPNDPDILLEMAELLRLVMDFESSLKFYQRVLALRSTDPEAQKWIPFLKETLAQYKATTQTSRPSSKPGSE